MAKYSERIADKIVHYIETEDLPVSEICNVLGICRKTYYLWLDKYPQLNEAIEQARERREEKLMIKARRALELKLEKHMLTTVKYKFVVTGENPEDVKLKEKIITTREYMPDDRTIRTALDLEEKRQAKKEKKLAIKAKEEHEIAEQEKREEENKPKLDKIETRHPEVFESLRTLRRNLSGVDKEIPYTTEDGINYVGYM